MTYSEAIDFLFNSLPVWEQQGAGAYKPGIDRIAGFLPTLGLDAHTVPAIHVAGTNGKGSTASMLAAVLQSASKENGGGAVGLFTSPHLVDFRERIRIDCQMISEEAVIEFTELYKEEMVALGLTFFEMTTAMALWWFSREGVQIAIIEAGLGGRLDSTNIITPLVSIITNIGLEHTQYLGSTIAAIASEKAGIIKPGVPVVVGQTDLESAPVFRACAQKLGSPIIFADSNQTPQLRLDLQGDHQKKNLATVLAAVDILRAQGFRISDEALRTGLANTISLTGLRGRWEMLQQTPLVVCDTAHNAHGFKEIVSHIERTLADLRHTIPYARLFMILGFAADKDLDAIIPLLPTDAHYILTQAATSRAMPAEDLEARFKVHDFDAETVVPVAAALEKALSLASPRDLIYIGGSNFIVGDMLITYHGKEHSKEQ